MLRKVQHRRQTSGHFRRDGARLLIDLRSTRHHVESSGRRTPRNRKSRFTPAVQVTLSWGNTHPWRLNAAWHCTTRKRTSTKENAEKSLCFPLSTAEGELMASFMPVRLVYFLTDDIGLLFRR